METVVDKNFRWRGMRVKVPLWIVSLTSFVQIVRNCTIGGDFFEFWVATWTLLFIASCVLGLYIERRLTKTYCCPKCRKNLGNHRSLWSEEEYVYKCKDCQILWRTLTYKPE